MKEKLTQCLAAAAILALLPVAALAQPPGHGPRARGPEGRRPAPPPELREKTPKAPPEAVRAVFREAREKAAHIERQLKAAREELEKALAAEEINEDQVMELAERIGKLETELTKTRLHIRIALAKAVGPERARAIARAFAQRRRERFAPERKLEPERELKRLRERFESKPFAAQWLRERNKRPLQRLREMRKHRPFQPEWLEPPRRGRRALRGERAMRGWGKRAEMPYWRRHDRRSRPAPPWAEFGRRGPRPPRRPAAEWGSRPRRFRGPMERPMWGAKGPEPFARGRAWSAPERGRPGPKGPIVRPEKAEKPFKVKGKVKPGPEKPRKEMGPPPMMHRRPGPKEPALRPEERSQPPHHGKPGKGERPRRGPRREAL